MQQQDSVKSFYPEYIAAHSSKTNRLLHFIGATLFFAIIGIALLTTIYWLIAIAILIGYVLPGIGHHYFENNKSFRTSKPLLCVLCATKMYFNDWANIFKGKRKIFAKH